MEVNRESSVTRASLASDLADDMEYFRERIDEARHFLKDFREQLVQYAEQSDSLDRSLEDHGYAEALQTCERMWRVTCEIEERLAVVVEGPSEHSEWFRDLTLRFRTFCAQKASLVKLVSWMSPPYLQARDFYAFPPSLYGGMGKRYNYVRSTNVWRDELAERWLRLLGFDPSECGIVPTSSGMAAYSLIENYLTSELLSPGAVVFVPRFTYPETNILQFRNKKMFTEVMEEHRSSEVILRRIGELKPDVIMLETMQNGLGTEVLDVPRILREIPMLGLGKPVHIVLDETLTLGCINPFRERSPGVEVYYTFSGSKYLQLGLDLGTAGAIIVPKSLEETLRQLSYMGDYSLYDGNAAVFPSFSRDRLEKRQARLRRNGAIIAERLALSTQLKDLVSVFSPPAGLPTHGETGISLPLVGGLITLDFLFAGSARDALNMRPYYNYIASAIETAHTAGIRLAYCESFGFPWTSLNVLGWCYESRMPPFIRISPGEECAEEATRIADILHDHLVQFAEQYGKQDSLFDHACVKAAKSST